MSKRSRTLLALFAVLLGALAYGFIAARRAAERRFANLSACLLGDPLAAGETASGRLRAIEHARPIERMKLDVGVPSRLVPEKPLSRDEKWPTRCQPYVLAFSRAIALRWLARRAVGQTLALADDLASDRLPSNLDELWREAGPVRNPRVVADSNVVRPWAPLTLLPQDHLVDVTRECPPFGLNATVDSWDPDAIVLGGKPGCTIVSGADGRPFASAQLGKLVRERKNKDSLEGVWKADVLGWQLKIDKGVASLAREGRTNIELGAADAFSTCNAGSTRAVLLQSHAPETIDVRFLDEQGVSEPARVELAVPDFPGHGKTQIQHGAITLNCREREARVAWAWSTSVDQVHQHAIQVASCTPGRCQLREARASIHMIWSLGCGYCEVELEPYSVSNPRVVDLFDAVALVWSTHATERARIAPLERLNEARDIVLWEKPEKSYDQDESLRARGPVALLGVSVTEPQRAHLFRIDARGVTPLSPQ